MIRFFQKLRAKKGFTLVELIVVIAIIGVLAAILVPVMLGYVTNSRVTSADSTAASFAKEIDAFLTECDVLNYGMKKGTAYSEFEFIISGGAWGVNVSNHSSAFESGTLSWAAVGAGTSGTAKSAARSVSDLLCIQMAGLFPEIQDGQVAVAVSGAHVIACAFTIDTVATLTIAAHFDITPAAGNVPAFLTNKIDVGGWDGNTAGIMTTGEVIGTYPKLSLV